MLTIFFRSSMSEVLYVKSGKELIYVDCKISLLFVITSIFIHLNFLKCEHVLLDCYESVCYNISLCKGFMYFSGIVINILHELINIKEKTGL